MNTHPGKILMKPRVTEKSAVLAESQNVYVFEVSNKANKLQIAKAVTTLYKVNPVKVNIVKLPKKNIVSRGKKGTTKGVVKAYVFLKKGDKIELS